MDKYYYQCFECGKQYSKDEIENNLVYLCPSCGSVQKNQPLKGVLNIFYNYAEIKKQYSAQDYLKLTPGKFWLADYLYPLEYDKNKLKNIPDNALELISLQSNPLIELDYNGTGFLAFDDTRNPTLSFKDRASSLVALKAIQLGITKIAAASTGNAGSSLAGICARLGLKSVIFVPKNIPEAKRIQIQSFGAEVIIVNGNYDLAFDTCLEYSNINKWYNRNTAYNPLTIEGKKSAAYDIFITTEGNVPDAVFVPVGDGVIIAGLYKGFWELKELGWITSIPKLIAVQAKGSSAVAKYCTNKKFKYAPTDSIADSICAGAPRNLYMAFNSIVKSNGCPVIVTDNEILSAQKYAAQNYGILIEPSSAASLAGFIKYNNAYKGILKTPMLLFTGNGLKDTSALIKWNKKIKPLSSAILKKKFHGKK